MSRTILQEICYTTCSYNPADDSQTKRQVFESLLGWLIHSHLLNIYIYIYIPIYILYIIIFLSNMERKVCTSKKIIKEQREREERGWTVRDGMTYTHIYIIYLILYKYIICVFRMYNMRCGKFRTEWILFFFLNFFSNEFQSLMNVHILMFIIRTCETKTF